MASPDSAARGVASPNGATEASARRALVPRKVERAVLVGVPAAVGGFVVLLAAARWPEYWAWIAPEQTPTTWLSSTILMLSSAGALLLAASRRMRGHEGAARWLVLGIGFGCLALDERFALHERVRDGYLAPRDLSVPFLPWVAPGDFLLLGYAVVGLAVLPLVLRCFSSDARARRLVLTGVALAAAAVVVDSFDVAAMSTVMEIRAQTAEEIVELASTTCFLLAVWLRLVPVLGAGDTAHVPDDVSGDGRVGAPDGAGAASAYGVEASEAGH